MSVWPASSLRNKAEIVIVKTGKTIEKGSMLNMYVVYMFLQSRIANCWLLVSIMWEGNDRNYFDLPK